MDFSVDESPAVRALGSLFKLTEVHLWDDGSGEVREITYSQEPIKLINGEKDYEESGYTRISGFCSLPEDVELAQRLNDLGLPLSFHTNKETRYGMSRGKRKGTRKNSHQQIEINDYLLDSIQVSKEESESPDSSKLLDQSETLKNGVVADIDRLSILSLQRENSTGSTACTSTLTNDRDDYNITLNESEFTSCTKEIKEDQSNDMDMELTEDPDFAGFSEFSKNVKSGIMDAHQLVSSGKWVAYWDDYFTRTYFYNVETEESTWDPPSGMEHLEFTEPTSNKVDGLPEKDNDQSCFRNSHMELIEDPDFAGFSEFSKKVKSGIMDAHQLASSGKWVAYWDDYFMRTYFYNVETEESTWDPPSGMEHLEFADPTSNTVDGLPEKDNDQSCFRNSDEVQDSCVVQSDLYSADWESTWDSAWVSSTDNDWPSTEKDNDQSCFRNSDKVKDSRVVPSDLYLAGESICINSTENWPSIDNVSSISITKREKKVRRTESNRKLSISSEDLQGVTQDVPPSISKYWCQRYLLFSRFDCGIKMDEEGWFSVTPEPLAKHHAVRCGNGAIVDFFTGVGGNAIQFAQRSKHVIAIDIDPAKIDYARHNAAIYGVDDNIDFMKGDSFSLAHKLKANTVFMSPPWGGPAYSKVKKFDMNTMLRPHDGQFLFNAGKEIAPKTVMFLPRNVDINQLAELSLSASPPWSLEVERNFLNGRLKAVTAYFTEPSIS